MIDREILSRHLFAALLIAAAFTVLGCRHSSASLGSGIDVTGMDKSVQPGDDFNAYANGGWIKATPIPADKAAYGIFAILADETRKRTRSLLDEAAKTTGDANSDSRKIGDYYSAFMDEAGIESKGIEPLKPQLQAIAAIADRRALSRAIGE